MNEFDKLQLRQIVLKWDKLAKNWDILDMGQIVHNFTIIADMTFYLFLSVKTIKKITSNILDKKYVEIVECTRD